MSEDRVTPEAMLESALEDLEAAEAYGDALEAAVRNRHRAIAAILDLAAGLPRALAAGQGGLGWRAAYAACLASGAPDLPASDLAAAVAALGVPFSPPRDGRRSPWRSAQDRRHASRASWRTSPPPPIRAGSCASAATGASRWSGCAETLRSPAGTLVALRGAPRRGRRPPASRPRAGGRGGRTCGRTTLSRARCGAGWAAHALAGAAARTRPACGS